MPSTPPTKKPKSKRRDVVIIPGGWGGRIHFAPLVRRLEMLGFRASVRLRTDPVRKAKLVVTHSVGCLEKWEPLATQAVLILGPTTSMSTKVSQTEIRRKLISARRSELSYQRRHRLLLRGSVIVGKGIIKSLQDPALMRHQYKLLKKNNFIDKVQAFATQHPTIPIRIITYKNDVWTEGSLKIAFRDHDNVTITKQNDTHDDILYRPTYYAAVIQGLLS